MRKNFSMGDHRLNVGVIGGGLMGKEVASAFGRWFMLNEPGPTPSLVAVADLNPDALAWFDRIETVTLKTTDYRELLADPDIDVVYVAIPHDSHEQTYLDVLAAGKDLLAEKPFGIDLAAAEKISNAVSSSGRFVRCSSEFPFFPGAQGVFQRLQRLSDFGDVLEVNASFRHSSDLDYGKPINWKRQAARCGSAGVMNDLGLHVCHLPFRSGLVPETVYAQLQDIVHARPDHAGNLVPCDTWDNATLHCNLSNGATMLLEMKRLAPGETNSWSIEVLGTKKSVRFSTKQPKTLHEAVGNVWSTTDLGHACAYPVATGAIFEFGFPDALLQMWAAFLAERDGRLQDRFGCATPEEALLSHRLWAAALKSNVSKRAEFV